MRVIQKTELTGIGKGKSWESPKLEQLGRGKRGVPQQQEHSLFFGYYFSLFGSDKQHVGF